MTISGALSPVTFPHSERRQRVGRSEWDRTKKVLYLSLRALEVDEKRLLVKRIVGCDYSFLFVEYIKFLKSAFTQTHGSALEYI
jgi:hypothetical protein